MSGEEQYVISGVPYISILKGVIDDRLLQEIFDRQGELAGSTGVISSTTLLTKRKAEAIERLEDGYGEEFKDVDDLYINMTKGADRIEVNKRHYIIFAREKGGEEC